MRPLSKVLPQPQWARFRLASNRDIAFSLFFIASPSVVFAAEEECYRPYPPERTQYESEEQFYTAKEEFFKQGSIYIACIDRWIEETRANYIAMYELEAEAYIEERNDVLKDLREFGDQTR